MVSKSKNPINNFNRIVLKYFKFFYISYKLKLLRLFSIEYNHYLFKFGLNLLAFIWKFANCSESLESLVILRI
jgi:hypothetical protein